MQSKMIFKYFYHVLYFEIGICGFTGPIHKYSKQLNIILPHKHWQT